MPFSKYLDSARQDCRELVRELQKSFRYVSILGADGQETAFQVNRQQSVATENNRDRGFVVKLHNGRSFFEYSLNDVSGDKAALAETIRRAVETDPSLESAMIDAKAVKDEPMKQDFVRESDFENYSDKELLDWCAGLRDQLLAKDEKLVNAFVILRLRTVDQLFVTPNRELSQHYGWANGMLLAVYSGEGRMVQTFEGENGHLLKDVMEKLPGHLDHLADKVRHLAKAKPIEPGVYDIITDASITGLIAHEAFGHGVEMDQFVKDRALAKHCMGQYVASPISNMHDGAAAALSAASYFFDDDGVLAHDTQIIKDGILTAGLSDLVSASELGTEPTGNGRRQSFKRKAYSRMTNTFFSPGESKLEDMIKSIKHGYMLFQTNNGMEDPKNWQIQCTAEYGIEIVDGELTENYVSPVVMSGYVPDLLKSISMISDGCEVIGSGMCGKGYKEWVYVADGGPALKARVKLG